MIPGAQLVVVPYTGHSVIGSDLTGCAETAVAEFFAGARASPCGPTKDMFAPTPITPTRLSAVSPTPGLAGKTGRTVTAVLDTILDLDRLVVAATLQAEQELPSGSRFGGLRGGFAAISSSGVRLVHFSFVRGVALSGTWPIKHGQLEIRPLEVEGSAAAHGSVLIHANHRVSGTLAGARFNVEISAAVLARAGGSTSSASSAWNSAWPLGQHGLAGVTSPLAALARVP